MKKTTILVILLISIIITFLILSGYKDTGNKEIGILDREQILLESRRAQQLGSQLDEIAEHLEKEYNRIENKVNNEQREEELENVYQQFIMNKETLEEKLNNEINQILSEMAAEMNFEVIILKEYTKFGGREITDRVIEKLDEKFYRAEVTPE